MRFESRSPDLPPVVGSGSVRRGIGHVRAYDQVGDKIAHRRQSVRIGCIPYVYGPY